MKKIFNYLICLLFLFIIFNNDVMAKEYTKEEIIGKCVYDESSVSEKGNSNFIPNEDTKSESEFSVGNYKLTIYILPDYSLDFNSDRANLDAEVSKGLDLGVGSKLYRNDTEGLDCKKVSEIMLFLSRDCTTKGECINSGWTVADNGFNIKSTFLTSIYQFNYKLNNSESEIYSDGPTLEQLNEMNLIDICFYGNYKMQFNKSTVESTIPELSQEDALKAISENSYSCPTTLCLNKTPSTMGGLKFKRFVQEYTEGKPGETCYVSTTYSRDFKCGSLSVYVTRYKELINSNNVADRTEVKKLKEEAKTFCDSVSKNMDYTDSNNCVRECLEIDKIFSSNEKTNVGECGFSGRLLVWIRNILRWIKYILPVIVIVTGIIDFIKAVAGDKDDDMKKAQSNFIKRLIAASLIFLIPFILEFILGKMGFGYNDCGLF